MLSDLKSALNNEPFDDLKYDDVYSTSIINEDENVLIPDIEEVRTAVEEITPSVSLKEEISIPEIVPVYNKKAEKRHKVKKFETLPEIKKNRRSNEKEKIKKLIMIALIAVVMIIMFVTSVVLHFSDGNKAEPVTAAIHYVSILSEVFNNGCRYD